MAVKRTRNGEIRVKERFALGKCLHCESLADANPIDGPGSSNGNCSTCVSRISRALARLPLEERDGYIASLVRKGERLENQEIRELRKKQKRIAS